MQPTDSPGMEELPEGYVDEMNKATGTVFLDGNELW
jgi:hypothetical protein